LDGRYLIFNKYQKGGKSMKKLFIFAFVMVFSLTAAGFAVAAGKRRRKRSLRNVS
jgi:hypothetical protein